MISIGPDRASAGCGGWQDVKGIGQKHPVHGRQGKSAASGRAQVVGWVENFSRSRTHPGWRFIWKHQQFQCPDRRRTPPRTTSAP